MKKINKDFSKKKIVLSQKKCSKFWVLKIDRKTYTSIPALLFRSDQGRDILVKPKKTCKNEHPNKRLALLILLGL